MKTLVYHVPVYIGINDDGIIEHVIVDDETPLCEGHPRLLDMDKTGDDETDAAEVARLVEIAKGADWPAWKFGL